MKILKATIAALIVSFLCHCGTPYGVWHPVKHGDTLYRISKTYGVPMEKIIKHNPQITDPTLIIAGDKLFIPGASEVKKLVPPEQPPAEVASSSHYSSGGEASELAAKGQGRDNIGDSRGSTFSKEKVQSVPVEKGEVSKPPKDYWESKDVRFIWPTKGQVTTKFAEERGGRTHRGIDIAAPVGTPVKAAESGQVIYSGKISGYGKVIVIQHPSGFVSVYAHNRKNLVEAGDWVKRGDDIAEVGETGRTSGPHLHFEIRVNNTPVDPLKYLPKGG